jgi:hypothetical protein
MPSTKQQILNEIKTHIQNNGGEYSDWHIGVCSNIRHNLSSQAKAKHLFISRQAFSSYVASEVQDYFINILGTGGSVGTNNSTADIIYVYRRSGEAIEQTSPANDTWGEINKKKRTEFKMSYDLACHWWKRSDLEAIPVDIKRVAEILYQAGIKVYEIADKGLSCEPRPLGVREALTGQSWIPAQGTLDNYPPEELGGVLRILADKGVPVTF